MLYRHWSAFTEFKRSHLFVQSVGRDSVEPTNSTAPQSVALPANEPRDLTPGDHDVPPFNLGGQDMYAISPDGQELAYTSNIDEVEATSTNNEIFVVPIDLGFRASCDAKKISTSPGADSTPLYSPDGKYLAWRSQARAGFEADKWRLLVQDRQSGKTRDLTEKFDRSVGSFAWIRDHRRCNLLPAEDRGDSICDCFADRQLLDHAEHLLARRQTACTVHADDLVYRRDHNALLHLRMSIDCAERDLAVTDRVAKATAQPVG